MTGITERQLIKIALDMSEAFRLVCSGAVDADELSHLLREVVEGKWASRFYPLFVDYERSIEEGINAGSYDEVNSAISSKNLPIGQKGQCEVTVELIRFLEPVTTGEVLRELWKQRYRPANIQELLAFGEKYPESQLRAPVIALGSTFPSDPVNKPYQAPVLTKSGSSLRVCTMFWADEEWTPDERFAVVRK